MQFSPTTGRSAHPVKESEMFGYPVTNSTRPLPLTQVFNLERDVALNQVIPQTAIVAGVASPKPTIYGIVENHESPMLNNQVLIGVPVGEDGIALLLVPKDKITLPSSTP